MATLDDSIYIKDQTDLLFAVHARNTTLLNYELDVYNNATLDRPRLGTVSPDEQWNNDSGILLALSVLKSDRNENNAIVKVMVSKEPEVSYSQDIIRLVLVLHNSEANPEDPKVSNDSVYFLISLNSLFTGGDIGGNIDNEKNIVNDKLVIIVLVVMTCILLCAFIVSVVILVCCAKITCGYKFEEENALASSNDSFPENHTVPFGEDSSDLW